MPTASGHTSAIRAKKVIGTDVKDPAGKSIGKVEDILLEKQSNHIMYAVVGFGGFLGMGEKYHPLPWSVLKYDDNQGAYIVNLTKEQLAAAPADSLDALSLSDGLGYPDRPTTTTRWTATVKKPVARRWKCPNSTMGAPELSGAPASELSGLGTTA
jgi:sporulation protein YlmC with PRC-barrel domain